MKGHSLRRLLFLVFLPAVLFPQIPNNSFENWTGGNPDGWTTNNVIGYVVPVTQSNSPRSGSYAVKMEMLTAMNSLFPPALYSGPLGSGIPVSQRYPEINFYYKYFPTVSTVSLVLSVSMYKNSAFIGVGVGSTKASAGSYTKMTIPISYFDSQTPDAAIIYITLIDSMYNPSSVGSYAVLDDIYFDQLIRVDDENTTAGIYELLQNYPNPFNPATQIEFSIPKEGFVSLKVYNALGQEAAVLVNGMMTAGSHVVTFDGTNLSSGVYLYRIEAAGKAEVRKMVLER